MSTVDHVIAACGSLRTAWGWLATASTPGRGRRNQRALSESAKAKRDNQARAERADRHALLTSGRVPTGQTSAPVNLTAVMAREQIAQEVDSTAWRMASAMRNLKFTTSYRPNGANADARFRTGLDWISTNAPRLTDRTLINETYEGLSAADTLARNVIGEGTDRRRLAAECPACGRRSLAWDCSSDRYEEWHVLCTSDTCRCQGLDCTCKIPDRQHGMTHVWLESAWNMLARQLEETS